MQTHMHTACTPRPNERHLMPVHHLSALRCLPGQHQGPPLQLVADSEVAGFLWSGPRSVAKRLYKAAAAAMAGVTVARALSAALEAGVLLEQAQRAASRFPLLLRMGRALEQPVATAQATTPPCCFLVTLLSCLHMPSED